MYFSKNYTIYENTSSAGKPYRYFDEKGNIYGLYIDILRVALKSLNLTLVIKETRPENQNIWFKK